MVEKGLWKWKSIRGMGYTLTASTYNWIRYGEYYEESQGLGELGLYHILVRVKNKGPKEGR